MRHEACAASPGRSHSECRTARHSALEKRVRIESLLAFLVVGVVAGWLAGQIVRGRGYGLLVNLVVGVLGAFIAGWLLPKLGVSVGGGLLADIIQAMIGAILLLVLIMLVRKS